MELMRRNERGVIVGRTGSGKSTLARVQLRNKYPVCIIDPKGDFELLSEYVGKRKPFIAHSPGEVTLKQQVTVFRPDPDHADIEHYDEVYEKCYWKGDIFVYTDEAACVCNNALKYPRHMRFISQQGRSRGIGHLAVMQDPSLVPTFLFSQSEHFMVFRIIMEQHLQKVATWIGEQATIAPTDKHAFWYRYIDDDKARLYVLRLPEERS